MNNLIPMAQLPPGEQGRVCQLISSDRTRRRMLDLGLIPQTLVQALRKSPSGDPTAYQIRGAVIALRSEEAGDVLVEMLGRGRS